MPSLFDHIAAIDTPDQGMEKKAQAEFNERVAQMYGVGESMALRDIRKLAAEEAGMPMGEEASEEDDDEAEKARILEELRANPDKAAALAAEEED